MSDIVVRYAASDDDVIAIHKFLCVVAEPTLPAPSDPKKGIEEIWRVVNKEAALMAICDGDMMVGTAGFIMADHWWGLSRYLVNRWMFAIPGRKAWLPLVRESVAIAKAAGVELHIISEQRGRLTIFNRAAARTPRPN
jgi:hypothetical protein